MQLRKWCYDIIITFERPLFLYNLPERLHKNIIVHHVLAPYHRPSRRVKPSTAYRLNGGDATAYVAIMLLP